MVMCRKSVVLMMLVMMSAGVVCAQQHDECVSAVPANIQAGLLVQDIIGLIQREIAKIIAQPDMKARLAELGYDPVASTPEEFAARIKVEIATWAKVIRAANIKPE